MQVQMPLALCSRVSPHPKRKADESRQARYLVEEAANQLGTSGINETLARLQGALQLFGDDPAGEDQVWTARAMLNLGTTLQRARRNEEAIAAFAAVIERFQGSSDDEIRKVVTLARAESGATFGASGV